MIPTVFFPRLQSCGAVEVAVRVMNSTCSKVTWIVLVAVIHSFSAGYSPGAIAGALTDLKASFPSMVESAFLQGAVVSCILIGALIGSQCAPYALEKYGRKRCIIYSNAFYLIGGIGMACSMNLPLLIAFRTLAGIGEWLNLTALSSHMQVCVYVCMLPVTPPPLLSLPSEIV